MGEIILVKICRFKTALPCYNENQVSILHSHCTMYLQKSHTRQSPILIGTRQCMPSSTLKFAPITQDLPVHWPSQWEMALRCNVVSNWLSPYKKWSLQCAPEHHTSRSISGPQYIPQNMHTISSCFISLVVYNAVAGFVSCWRHQMETFSALLAICTGNSPVPGEFPAQRPVTRSFDVFFDLRPNKRLSKPS